MSALAAAPRELFLPGTGYNAALLAQRSASVTTVEVDHAMAEHARTALQDFSRIRVVAADGAAGHPQSAPFDRIIATAATRLGQFPYDWVAQTRPGGVIVAPVRTDLTAGPLLADAPRWAIAVALPQCRYDVWERTPDRT
ncbi:MAG: protein-L-isoaspartate O-methyltransferase family protein, partial [Gammaproteobacteria bacterium]